MSKGYSVDDIFDEIKRKKEREAAQTGSYGQQAAPQYRQQAPQYSQPAQQSQQAPQYSQPVQQSQPAQQYRQQAPQSQPAQQYPPPQPRQGDDFFDRRQSGAQVQQGERVPTYSPERHGGDPMTTHPRDLYDTLGEYFGKGSQT